ncbi:MAG: PKD domain-containing protein [Pseudomonadales bacterium]|nr:PKD domain-containing protein [Pseudomonadales bacterium]
MRLLIVIVLLSLAPVALADCDSQSDIPTAECNVLEAIYESAAGENWTDNSNWLNDSPCSWFGVTCTDGSVYRLYLADNNLIGTLPPLSDLTNVHGLNFDFNQLSGPLPDLSGLTKLEGADFFDNQFNGEIPAMSNLPQVSYLNFGFNQLSGGIPESFAALPFLSSFIVEFNQLSGSLPSVYKDSNITGFVFDWEEFCVNEQSVYDWLDGINVPLEQVEFCWTLSAEAGDTLLASGDVLSLFAKVDTPELTDAVSMDLYLSLSMPDGDSETYLVLTDSGIETVMGGATEADWVPTVSNFTLEPGFNSGLTPVLFYPFDSTADSGTYTFNVRATTPGTTDIILDTEASVYYHPLALNMAISAQSQAETNESINLVLNTDNDLPGVTYHWDFDDGNTTTGKSVSHSFDVPDRYQVKVTAEIAGTDVTETALHYINVGRPLAQTIYPLMGSSFTSNEQVFRDFFWNACEANWEVYHGKYFKLWFEAGADPNVERQVISNGLLFADYLFEQYSTIFGWDYLPSVPALDIYICESIPGGGTGTGGTFLNNQSFINRVGDVLSAQDYVDYIHEFIHAWDFRGGAWLNSEDSAHAFTGGMEPVIQHLLGTGQGLSSWGGDLNLLQAFEPDFLLHHYMRVFFQRYMSRPNHDWSTYYGSEFLSYTYETEPIPEHKETMLVQGGMLTAIYTMHGLEGLQKIFAQLEKNLVENPDTYEVEGEGERVQADRAQNFMRVVADGLQLDVSDYFAYWKWPVESLDAYMSRYPLSDKIQDMDGDGFAPLHGDLNDADATVYPFAPELMDGIDNNLDGLVDEHVYYDGSPDIDTQAISLPAKIIGNIDSLEDVDSFQFHTEQSTVVHIVIYSVDSDTTVPYSIENERPVSTFAGTVYLNNRNYSEMLHEAMSAPEAQSATWTMPGTNTITISPVNEDGRTSNPGSYEIQIFENDYEHALPATEVLSSLYPDN